MKIGIITHSQTGNTYSVAQALEKKLSAAGHSVKIEKIEAVDSKQMDPKKLQLKKLPDLSGYEGLVLAAPVQGFSASSVMKVYLGQLPALSGKKVACLVTKGLPFDWTGGSQALALMAKSCEARGGKVVGSGIVKWRKGREGQIAALVEKLGAAF